jgi:hypothetical protein
LQPLDASPRIFEREAGETFIASMQPALLALGIDGEAYRERALPLQHVWRATKRPPRPLHLCSTMLDHVGGVSHVRVVQPMHALGTEPGVTTTVIANGDVAPPLPPETPGLFIFHRPLLAGAEGLHQVRQLIAEGWLVLCEFDDHPSFLPAMQREEVHNFSAVHAVQTSTEPLAEVLRASNPEVAVFPNAVARLPEPRNFADPNRLTLYFAGLNREQEWPPFVEALNNVEALAGERLQFRIVADAGLFEALQTPHKSFVPLCDYQTYQALLAESEISFMPLLDNPFNRCKSDLKFIEAAACRVAGVASPGV